MDPKNSASASGILEVCVALIASFSLGTYHITGLVFCLLSIVTAMVHCGSPPRHLRVPTESRISRVCYKKGMTACEHDYEPETASGVYLSGTKI